MKQFIKEHLRIQLEGRLARHTSSNTHQDRGLGDTKSINRMSENEWKNEINLATEIYNNYDDIMGSTNDGDGLYEFVLYREGGKFVLKPKENSTGRKRESGDVNKSNNSAYIYMKASKPNEDIPELREFMAPKIGKDSEKYTLSATDIAYIKILALMGNTIKDFIDGSLGYTTSDAEKIASKNTDSSVEYKRSKLKTDKNNPDFKRKETLSIDGPDYTKNPAYVRLSTQLKNKLELSKKLDNPALTQDIATLKAEIEKIKANHGK